MRRVAVVQMVSSAALDDNLLAIERLLAQAAAGGAVLVVLPENCTFMGAHETDKLAFAEAPGTGLIQTRLSRLAKQYKLWLVAGTLPLKAPDGRVWASSLVFDAEGHEVARYDKMHLFDVRVSSTEAYQESETIAPGQAAVVVDTPVGRLGLSVCYDVRFPELYRQMVAEGAEIFTVVAAFTKTTGAAHWHTLLQARAIENMCYMLASNQAGLHANGQETYGHSLIADPWGKVLEESATGEGLIFADLDLEKLHARRISFPCLKHRVL